MFVRPLTLALLLAAAGRVFCGDAAARADLLPPDATNFVERYEKLAAWGDAPRAALVRDHADAALGAFRALTRSGIERETVESLPKAWAAAFGSSALIESEKVRREQARTIQPLLAELSEAERLVESRTLAAKDAKSLYEKLKKVEARLRKTGDVFHAEDAAQLMWVVVVPDERAKGELDVKWPGAAPTHQQATTRAILECGLAIRTSKPRDARAKWWAAFRLQAEQPSAVTLQRMEEMRDFVGEICDGSGTPSEAEWQDALFAVARKMLAKGQAQLAARYAREAQQIARRRDGEFSKEAITAQGLLAKAMAQTGDIRNAIALSTLADGHAARQEDVGLQALSKGVLAEILFQKERYKESAELFARSAELAKKAGNSAESERSQLNQAKAELQQGNSEQCRPILDALRQSESLDAGQRAEIQLLWSYLETMKAGSGASAVLENPSLMRSLADAGRYDLLEKMPSRR